jgi:hypothetical protein
MTEKNEGKNIVRTPNHWLGSRSHGRQQCPSQKCKLRDRRIHDNFLFCKPQLGSPWEISCAISIQDILVNLSISLQSGSKSIHHQARMSLLNSTCGFFIASTFTQLLSVCPLDGIVICILWEPKYLKTGEYHSVIENDFTHLSLHQRSQGTISLKVDFIPHMHLLLKHLTSMMRKHCSRDAQAPLL